MRAFLKRTRGALTDQLRRAHGNLEHTSKVLWMVHQFNLAAEEEEIELIRHLDGDSSS